MRELKFRVWCKRTQEYHTTTDDVDDAHIWLRMCIDTNGRLYFIETSNEDADYEYVTHDCEIIENQDDNFTIEQYTGLKDKNGKEIYEGDIVEALIDGMWSTGRSTVGFGKAKWRLEALYNDIRFMDVFRVIGSKNCPDRIYYLFDKELSDIEVIGNIHENQDLLGDIIVTNKEKE